MKFNFEILFKAKIVARMVTIYSLIFWSGGELGSFELGKLTEISGIFKTQIHYKQKGIQPDRVFTWYFWRDPKTFTTKRTIGPFERARGLGASCEVWSKRRDGGVIQSRVFLKEKRIIEFSNDELVMLNHKSNWEEVACVAPISFVKKKFNFDGVSMWQGRYREEKYSSIIGDVKYTVHWLPDFQIARRFIFDAESMTVSVDLNRVQNGHGFQDELPKLDDDFHSYDFADLGDLEAEPGLISLIHKYSIPHQICRLSIEEK